MRWLQNSARGICWFVLATVAFFALAMLFGGEDMNEGNSSIAALMVVIALTGLIWVPIALLAAIMSLVADYRATGTYRVWLHSPAVPVLLLMLTLLYFMFA